MDADYSKERILTVNNLTTMLSRKANLADKIRAKARLESERLVKVDKKVVQKVINKKK